MIFVKRFFSLLFHKPAAHEICFKRTCMRAERSMIEKKTSVSLFVKLVYCACTICLIANATLL